MTPDLEAYAPAFRAVFGQDDRHRIPYEVHDRRTRDDASFYDDFLAVLDVLDSRFFGPRPRPSHGCWLFA